LEEPISRLAALTLQSPTDPSASSRSQARMPLIHGVIELI
jgi:hypothetical protein